MAEPTIRSYPRSLARNMDLTGRQDISSSVKNIALNMYETGWLPPTGSVFPFAGTGVPFGYLLCDGAAVSRDVYSGLFYVIGELYGPGDGTTTFNLPNMKGLFPVMRDPANPDFTNLGQTGGSGAHTLTIPEMPIHNHTGFTSFTGAHNHTGLTISAGAHNHTGLTDSAGSHLHSITDVQHSHSITDVQHSHSITDVQHQHEMKTETVESGSGSVVANNDQGFGGIDGSPAFSGITGTNPAFSGITGTNPAFSGITSTNSAGAHTHGIQTDGVHQHGIQTDGLHRHIIDNQGGSLPHNNLPPYFTLNFIIKL